MSPLPGDATVVAATGVQLVDEDSLLLTAGIAGVHEVPAKAAAESAQAQETQMRVEQRPTDAAHCHGADAAFDMQVDGATEPCGEAGDEQLQPLLLQRDGPAPDARVAEAAEPARDGQPAARSPIGSKRKAEETLEDIDEALLDDDVELQPVAKPLAQTRTLSRLKKRSEAPRKQRAASAAPVDADLEDTDVRLSAAVGAGDMVLDGEAEGPEGDGVEVGEEQAAGSFSTKATLPPCATP